MSIDLDIVQYIFVGAFCGIESAFVFCMNFKYLVR